MNKIKPKKMAVAMVLFILVMSIILGILIYKKAFAASVNCYWVGDTNPAIWNDASHWSSSDGGGGNTCDSNTVPGSDDTVYFTASNSNDVTVDIAPNVKGINIASGYGGNLNQQAGLAITIGTNGYTQAGGTFTGSDAAVTINGSYTLSGGIFNSTSATLTVASNFTHTAASGTFNEGTGTVKFLGNNGTYDVNSSETFYNVDFNTGGNWLSLAANDTMVVDGTINFNSGEFWAGSGSIINANGNINQATGFVQAHTSPRLNFSNDGVAQTYTIAGGTTPYIYFDTLADASDQINFGANDVSFYGLNIGGTFSGDVPIDYSGHNLAIRYTYTQTAGNFIAPSILTTGSAFTKTGGTFAEGTGLIRSNSTGFNVDSSETFYNFETIGGINTVTSGDTLIINGTLTLTSGSLYQGTVNANGNITQAATFGSSTLNDTRLNFSNDSVNQTYTIAGGITPYIYFDSLADASDQINFGANDVSFYGLYIGGTFSGDVPIDYNGHNLAIRYTYTQTAGTFTPPAVFTTKKFIKSGGDFVEGSGKLVINGDYDVASSETFYNVDVVSGGIFCISTNDTMVVNGTLTFAAGGDLMACTAGTGTINANGNITQAATFTTDNWSVNLNFSNDSANQTYTIAGGTGPTLYFDSLADANDSVILNADATLQGLNITAGFSGSTQFNYNNHNLTLSDDGFVQAAGTFTVPATLTVVGNFTKTGGIFNEGTNTVRFYGNQDWAINVATTETFYNVIFDGSNAAWGHTIATGDTIVVDGTLTLTNGYVNGPGIISAKGNVINLTTSDGGTIPITLSGTTDQTYTLSSGVTPTGTLTVTKSSGIAYLTGTGNLHNIAVTEGKLYFQGGSTYTIDDADAINTSAGTVLGFNGSLGSVVTLRSDAAAQWDLNVNASASYFSNYVDVAYSNAAGGREITTYNSTNSLNNANWVFGVGSPTNVSGSCQKFDQSTSCANGETIKIAVNGALQAQTALTAGGTWTIYSVLDISSGHTLTVFVDGVIDSLEANAVTKYDGSGDVTGLKLYEDHLSIGSDDNQTISNSDISQYDNSISGNEDIFFNVTVDNDLVVDATSQSAQEELIILANNTFRPDSGSSGNINTFSLENNGTLTADGNTFYLGGNWDNNSVFNADSGTVNFNNAVATQIIDSTGASSASFNTLTKTGATTLQLASALTVTGTTTLPAGSTLDLAGQTPIALNVLSNEGTVKLKGSEILTITTQDTNSGTFEYVGNASDTHTVTDFGDNDYFNLKINSTSGGNLFNLGANLKLRGVLTVDSGTFSTTGSNYSITLGQYDQTTSGYQQNGGALLLNDSDLTSYGNFTVSGGTFTAGTSNVILEVTAQSISLNAPETFYDLTLLGTINGGSRSVITGSGTYSIGHDLLLKANHSGDVILDASIGNPDFTIANDLLFNGTGSGKEQISMGSGTWFFSRNVNLDAGVLDGGTSKSIFDSTSVVTSSGVNQSFYDVDLGTASGGASVTVASKFDVNGQLMIKEGGATSLNLTNADFLYAGATLNLTGIDTFTKTNSTVTLDGSVGQSLTSSGKSLDRLIVLNISAEGTSFSDSLTTTGMFSGMGAGGKITFLAGGSYQFGDLSINGQSYATRTILRSSTLGEQWLLSVPDTSPWASYVDVQDSDASPNAGWPIFAYDGTNINRGNNVNWLFGPYEVNVSPADTTLGQGATQQFTFVGKDIEGTTITGFPYTWAADPAAGSITTPSGLFTAGTTSSDYIDAISLTSYGKVGYASVHINALAATPTPTPESTATGSGNTGGNQPGAGEEGKKVSPLSRLPISGPALVLLICLVTGTILTIIYRKGISVFAKAKLRRRKSV